MAELAPGSRFGRYRIDGIAGQGGMGVVYRATELGLDRSVALKVITPAFAHDEEFRERFKRESKLAASIEHPNVIPVYEAGEHGGVLFLAMRYVDGTDLGSLLRREGRLEPIRAARLVAQMGAALDAAHAAGLVHRDVKPANALIAFDDHVYLSDFGLTKRVASGSALTKTGHLVGTVDYVAPEQVEGSAVDARTDVYSLGCVLFHLVTGRLPYEKPSEMAKLFAHLHEAPPVPSEYVPGLPSGLDAVVARSMAKDPSERWLSAGDLGHAAVAAAEQRAFVEPERSVARGEAAPTKHAVSTRAESMRPGEVRSGLGAAAGRTRRGLLIGGAVALALVAAVVAGALIAGGGSGGSSSDTGVSAPSVGDQGTAGPAAPAADSGTAGELTTSGAINTAFRFADYFTDANLAGLERIFTKQGFEQTDTRKTCSEGAQPMSLAAALADYSCIWQIRQAEMKLSGVTVDTAERVLTASYTLVFEGQQTGSGKVTLRFVPVRDQDPLIDRIEYSAG
jgi:predicted Ser/Thr protein kinase